VPAGLHVRALGSIGVLFGVYVVARTLGKLAGPLITAWTVRRHKEDSRRFLGLGMSLIPQAGAAVGLGILARDVLPVSGETILAAVLASVVVFELIGPMGVQWAAKFVGEAKVALEDEPLTLTEALSALQNRRARLALVVGAKADPSLLDTPRQLAARLGADLMVVPVSDALVARPSTWGQVIADLKDDKSECTPDLKSVSGCREFFLDTVSVENGATDKLVAALAEQTPAVVLFAHKGLPAGLSDAGGDLSRRLACPVLKVPAPQIPGRRRLWEGGRLAEVLGTPLSIFGRSRGVQSGPAKETPAKEAPAKEAPAKEAPAKDDLAKEASANEAPAKEGSEKDGPASGGDATEA